MSSALLLQGCDEICLERISQKADAKRRDACSIRPMPEISHDSKEDLMFDAVNPEDESISMEEGDRILATGLIPTPSMDICASSTISQRLVLGDLTAALGNQTGRTSNSSKTTETKRHGSKPLVSRIG